MTRTILVTLLVVFGASDASAQPRTLRWARLAVTAHLDADGRLHVQERHSIVFDGDWNGGERIFRGTLENAMHLGRVSRVDESGALVNLHEDKDLSGVDAFAWTDAAPCGGGAASPPIRRSSIARSPTFSSTPTQTS